MFHEGYVWSLKPLEMKSLDELARRLTEMTECLCTGYDNGEYVLLNDSTSADGAQEWAVVKVESRSAPNEAGQVRITGRQVESLTASWMPKAELYKALFDLLTGKDHVQVAAVDFVADGPNHSCRCCA